MLPVALVLFFLPVAVLWAMVLRPQQERRRAHEALVDMLEAGDEVVTIGGICGRVVSVDAEVVQLDAGPGVVLAVVREAIIGLRVAADEPAGR